jgi:agmatinase
MKYPEEYVRNWILRNSFPKINVDTPTFMRQKHAISESDLEGADVVIIGAPYVASWASYSGVDKKEWLSAPKRVRQQSARYNSGYIQEFDLNVFDYLKVVDFGDANIPSEVVNAPTVKNILEAQQAVEEKVNQTFDAGAIPIVIGQNSPCGSYAIAKPLAERTEGNVGVISLDTHWDIQKIDKLTMDPRIAGSSSWKSKMYEFHENILQKNLVEIGERGLLYSDNMDDIREFIEKGAHFYSLWNIRQKGIEWVCKELKHAYENTDAVYVHFDLDVIGGAGPAPGDILGELAEPIGMNDYEVCRISYEIGKRGFDALSFICIPPGSPVIYRTVVHIIMYFLAGMIHAK